MSETRWTKEQLEAITEKNCNLLVAAAAGAGKTAVLVERIIQKIIDEKNSVDIDSLLVVTFTNAAATEMRERIGAAISKAMEGNRDSKNIQKQLALLNKASITTIHSFCLEVIRNNFQNIDIDPNFRILDETEATLLKIETLNELFEEIYEDEQGNPDFFELLEAYGSNRDDQNIQDMVLGIYSFIQSYPWPEQWLNQQVENYNLQGEFDFVRTQWGRILLENIHISLNGLLELFAAACQKLNCAVGLQNYLPAFINDTNNLNKLAGIISNVLVSSTNESTENNSWDSIYLYINNMDFETLPRCGKDADKKVQEEVKNTRDEIKAFIKKLKEEIFFMKSEDIVADMNAMYPLLKCITRLVLDFTQRYALKKNQRSALDFNDLEHFCLKILSETDETGAIVPTKAAKLYKERFSEILVDEYQDSNLVQEIIIKMISREDTGTPNVFMVGDVKQSIYRFRQAKPELFLDKYHHYSGEQNTPYRKILLFKNFRSRKEVVDGVNFIFKQIMSQGVGELNYTKEEELNPGADYPDNPAENMKSGGAIELHLIETSTSAENIDQSDENTENNDLQEDEILDNIQKEARMVAKRITELMEPDENGKKFAVFDKKLNGYRDVQFRDVVILFRTTKNWTDIFTEELAQIGIPTFADTGSGFFKTPEIQVILSLLQIIDNPYQDIPLLAVLRSQIVNFNTDDLAELRLADRNASLYDALKALAASNSDISGKAGDFLSKLEQWRAMSVYMSTHKLIWQLYNDTGYYSIAGAFRDGEKKQANLRMLFERSLQFEATSFKGLFNFINFIDKLKTSKGDLGSAKVLGENDNVVRLMSIHKSKGLEFPVVFLCGCGKKINFQDMYKSILLHQELGFGPDYVDYKKRIKYPSIAKQAIAQKVKVETLSEEMRILYVALTRAKEKLILTGAVNNLQKTAGKWLNTARTQESKLPEYEMLKAQNYLGWICPAIIRHNGSIELRELAGLEKDFEADYEVSDESSWSVFLYGQKDIAAIKRIEQDETADVASKEWLHNTKDRNSGLYEEIDRRLNWNYKFEHLKNIPSKISVTELKRYFNINDESDDLPVNKKSSIKKPVFLQEKKGLSSAEKGTIMHFVMQHINFFDNNFENQISSMVTKELITEQQAKSVNIEKIRKFVASDLGRRLIKADSFSREVPFNIELPFNELFPECNGLEYSEEKILLQGVIDCYFQENDTIILIDYKTDYVADGNIENIKEKYSLQLSYYARALELLTGLRVKEKYIYLFSTGEIVEV